MVRERPQDPEPDPEPNPEPNDVQYGAAVREIEQILASIDRDEIDLDELGQKVERAVDLLKVCRTKLKATEARVTQVLKDLAKDEAADAAAAASDELDDDAAGTVSSETGEILEADAEPGAAGPDAAAPKRKGRRKKDDDDEELPF